MADRPTRFILLPARGTRADTVPHSPMFRFLTGLPTVTKAAGVMHSLAGKAKLKMRVLDSIHENGAKLVEMTQEAALGLRAEHPGLRIVPEVMYKPALFQQLIQKKVKALGDAVGTKIRVRVASSADGNPIAGARVVAFTDFANGEGAEGVTNAAGIVGLSLGGSSADLERLYVFPRVGFWSVLKKNITIETGTVFKPVPIDLAFTDCLRHFYGTSLATAGQGVKVAVIDSGIDLTHADLTVTGGENTVQDEDATDFGDNGQGHGTHVAGIIAAHGAAPTGVRGLAPAATLFSFRVFGKDNGEASNFAISKAIDRAVLAGCDLINLSLGGGDPDEAVHEAIRDARAKGVVVFAAAGNDGRQPVSLPASLSEALAVSAMGRKGTFPPGTSESAEAVSPFGNDAKNFIAGFSNVGPEIDLTGPGVGILSTFPGGHKALSGTSMACPAVCGFAAKLLAERADIMNMPRDQSRSDAMIQAVFQAAQKFGFGPTFEGQGFLP